jgi:hypothetical protein
MVIQEAFCSRYAIVKCGHDEIGFDRFYDLVEFMKLHNTRPSTDRCPENPEQPLIRLYIFPFLQIFQLVKKDRLKESPIKIDLFRWLNYTGNHLSKLPRDRVYALLNLSFDTARETILPDYSPTKSDRRIFSEVTAYIMKLRSPNRNLITLQVRQIGKELELPSWVPDWTIQSHSDRILTGPGETRYCAAQDISAWKRLFPDLPPLGMSLWDRPIQFGFSDDFETLFIRGACIDTVSYSFSICDADQLARTLEDRKLLKSAVSQMVRDACRAWEAHIFTMPRNVYGSNVQLSNAIWRTMMGNRFGDGPLPATADYGVCYKQWKEAVAEGITMVDSELTKFNERVSTFCHLRAFCVTDKGRIGLVPAKTQKGDLVCIFSDGEIPYVLRAHNGHHSWIGEAYIHGVMFGEALEAVRPGDVAIFEVT